MTSWHSYPKIYNVGHKYISDLLIGHVIVEEKVDGSQFSFGIFNGELKCRSKGVELNIEDPEKMFSKAVTFVKSIQYLLKDGFTYRGEYLQKPKHNTLAYDRAPNNNIILFDINPGEEVYISSEDKKEEAARLGLETVPVLYEGDGSDLNLAIMTQMLEHTSVLGGQKIEGVVIKNYALFGPDKKVLMGKHVSEAFKEIHSKEWKVGNPGREDIIAALVNKYKTPARWNKAIQHLKEKGLITDSPKDIGLLIKETKEDLLLECTEEIKEDLFNYFKDQILRGSVNGLPEHYKNLLLESQFKLNDPQNSLECMKLIREFNNKNG